MTNRALVLSFLLTAVACEGGATQSPPALTEGGAAPGLAQAPAAAPAAIAAPAAVMPGAHAAFDDLRELIDTHYVDGPLSEDELWSAAAEGVLARLLQRGDVRVNRLMSPQELAQLHEATTGRLVGVGVVVDVRHGTTVVRSTIAGGPAERAGLLPGDRILGVDGERVDGLEMMEIVRRIRGDAGSTVVLFVQRDIEEWDVTITRAPLVMSSVESTLLADGVGYVRINSFAETTPADLDGALAGLNEEGARRLVLDLRACPGGLLHMAIEAADRFLPPGALVTTLRGPSGERALSATEENPYEELPMVVLVGEETASGGEILAGALRDHDRATLVGTRTFGKGTVESIHELDNGWAVRLSQHRYFLPGGDCPHEVGVAPHVVLSADADHANAPIGEVSPENDSHLATAVQLLAAAWPDAP